MTVVAAYVDHEAGRVHLAADSVAAAGSDLTLRKEKIHTLPAGLDDQVVLGFAGDAACGHLIVAHLKLDATPDDTDTHANRWAQTTASAITEILLERNRRDEDARDNWDGVALLAWHGRCWLIATHLAVPIERYHAIGHGDAVATGAMWALALVGTPPQNVARSAVAAAIEHVAGIGGPVQTATTGPRS